jgi:hypothetical protein
MPNPYSQPNPYGQPNPYSPPATPPTPPPSSPYAQPYLQPTQADSQPYGQAPYGQPPYGSPYGPPSYAIPPAKKSHTAAWLLGGAGVVVLLLILGCVSFFVVRSNKSDTSGPTTTSASHGATVPEPTNAATSGSDGGSTGSTNTKHMKVGTTITVTDGDGDGDSMNVTVNKVTYRTTGCDTGDFNISDPQPGDAYVLLDVTYAVSKGTGSYNPLDWSVVDSAGHESDDSLTFADCKPELNSSDNLTDTRRGLVVIEVKKGATHGQAVYSPDFGESSSSWDF